MPVNGHKEYVDLFLGVVTRNIDIHSDGENCIDDNDLTDSGKVLRDTFLGNFAGTQMLPVKNVPVSNSSSSCPADSMSKAEIIQESFEKAQYIAAVSSIPAMRNMSKYKNQEYVQGLEKLIDTLRGKEYSILIIADAMNNSKVEEMCAEYEDLYSQLIPFKALSQTVNLQILVQY